jgi:hypothetical protein
MLAVVPRAARGAVCRLGSRTVLEGWDAVLDIRLIVSRRHDPAGMVVSRVS